MRLELKAQASKVVACTVFPGRIFTNFVRNIDHKPGLITEEEKAKMAKQFDEGGKGITAADAAAQIIKAIQRKKPRLLIGSDMRLIDKVVRLFPTGYAKMVLRKIRADRDNSVRVKPVKVE